MFQLLTLAIDPNSSYPSASILSSKDLQYESMLRATHEQPLQSPRFIDLFVPDGADVTDVCLWAGVQCTDNAIKNIAWDRTNALDAVGLGWLPNSVLKIHLHWMFVGKEIDTRTLPRNILYLFCNHCQSQKGALQRIELRTLPKYMLELHLMQCGLTGNFFLTDLPKQMRTITLVDVGINLIYVLNASLPASLVEVHAESRYNQALVKCMDGKKTDMRVRRSTAMALPSLFLDEMYRLRDRFHEAMKIEQRFGALRE